MIALVTGATRGIGLAIATALSEGGHTVIATARRPSEQLDALRGKHGKLSFIACDNTLAADRAALVDKVIAEHGRIDLLVNNAGAAPKVRKDMLDITEEDFDYLLNINLKGGYFLTQAVAGRMIENRAGRIINISSVSSYTASVNRAEYCISKAGISMCTKLYAARLAEYGIGVFEISPGIIETDMTAPVKDKYASLIEEGITPIRRFGKASDVASCVTAIASGALDFCTGTVLNADGGFSVRRL